MRLDKFLKVSRVIKRRTVANEACDNGRVSINGRQAKAGTAVKPGDVVTVEFANGSTKFEILSVEENVKKANATEMYRIITSLILAVFIAVGALTGFTGCSNQIDTEPGDSYVMTVDETKIYDEQFCYLFSLAAQETAGTDYSAQWLNENMDEVIEAAGQYATDMAALYNSAEKEGFSLTEAELYTIKKEISLVLAYNLELNEDENIDTNDEMCYYLTGMNVQEYLRFSVLKKTSEKYLECLMEDYAPSEDEQLGYYKNHKADFKACSIGKIYIQDKTAADEAYELLKNGTYSFEIVAKGWSEDENVLKTKGVETVTSKTTTLPSKVVKWAVAQEAPSDTYEMIYAENYGYYIVNCREILSYENCEQLRQDVLQSMIKEEQVSEIESSAVEFDKEKATEVVKEFLEGRKV